MTDRVITKVEVDVEDNRKFQDLVLLLDRPDFLEDLNEYRNLFEKESNGKEYIVDSVFKATWPDEALRIVKKYKYPNGFAMAVGSAMLNGTVKNLDVRNCYSAILMHPRSLNDSYTVTLTRKDLVIFIEPSIVKRRQEALKDEFNDILSTIPDTVILPANHPLNLDIREEIRDQRKIFWDREINSIRTLDLSKIYQKTPEAINQDLRRYRKLLRYDISDNPNGRY